MTTNDFLASLIHPDPFEGPKPSSKEKSKRGHSQVLSGNGAERTGPELKNPPQKKRDSETPSTHKYTAKQEEKENTNKPIISKDFDITTLIHPKPFNEVNNATHSKALTKSITKDLDTENIVNEVYEMMCDKK